MIPWLAESNIRFPPVNTALDEPNGLLAAGGNLSTSTLLRAYRAGIFPWYSDSDPILWWSPDPRFVMKPSDIHISKSMGKLLAKNPFTYSCDTAFEKVILCCAEPRSYTNSTWITDDMMDAYCQLHQQGHAHSIEVWQRGELAGGIYGVAIGTVFFGESMFSKVSNASKAGFIMLAKTLDICGYGLIDCQVSSKHLKTLGAYSIGRADFIDTINRLTSVEPVNSAWDMLNQHD